MKPYTVKQINPNTWCIAEVYHLPAALPMFLVVGTERAALIDTGMGIGDLPGTVREITDKPVSVYCTHAHMDHAGGNQLFEQVFMHRFEEKSARTPNPKEARMEFIELKCMYDPECDELLDFARKNMVEYDTNRKIEFIEEGELIDLGGGVVLEPILVPGHTRGSLVYVDRKNKTAFCGDAINARSSIACFGGGMTVEIYQHALERLLKLTPEITDYYMGHRLYAFHKEDIEDVIDCAKEIVEGVPAEPCTIVMSRKGPLRAWIHWHNGKRIVFGNDFRK